MKKLFTIGLLAGLAVTAYAGWTTSAYTPTGDGKTTNVVTAVKMPATVARITVTAGANEVTLQFFDSASTNCLITNAAYTSYVSTNGVRTSIITNSQNLLQTNYYPGVFTYATNIAAATNTMTPFYTATVPANSTSDQLVQFFLGRGMTVYATTNPVSFTTQWTSSY